MTVLRELTQTVDAINALVESSGSMVHKSMLGPLVTRLDELVRELRGGA